MSKQQSAPDSNASFSRSEERRFNSFQRFRFLEVPKCRHLPKFRHLALFSQCARDPHGIGASPACSDNLLTY